jgi:hypothetical protein
MLSETQTSSLTFTTLQPERMWRFDLADFSYPTVDAFYKQIVALHQAAKGGQTLLFLIDASAGATSPYFRQRLMEVHALAQTLPCKTSKAIVADEKYSKELNVFATLTSMGGGKHRLKIFHDLAEAQTWLEGQLS